MVNLVIMRHGEAQPYAADDSLRQLTPDGQNDVRQMALWLKTVYANLDYVWSSPYLRAQQTAELMLEQQPAECQFKLIPELVPDATAEAVKAQIDALLLAQPNAKLLLVSHMPLVSFLVESFTEPGQAPIFSTASLTCISYQPGQGGVVQERNRPLALSVLPEI
ncbi:MAG: phosphohistidine phosphatase SixA [Alishewanella sp.]|nr:phosphohistidine phosphatase SixA [Alishewanella sp.]MDP5185738.1 phosphohistidine phosphatase SixA [Alishewanella sp.]